MTIMISMPTSIEADMATLEGVLANVKQTIVAEVTAYQDELLVSEREIGRMEEEAWKRKASLVESISAMWMEATGSRDSQDWRYQTVEPWVSLERMIFEMP